jgi:hypothetical protein
MSIGLRLEGRRAASPSMACAERIARWIEERGGEPSPSVRVEVEERAPIVVADLHPGAEPVLIEVPSEERAILSASTGTAGPGYHRHVCELALALGDALGIEWDRAGDESGWLADRDDAKLEARFLSWLEDIARQVVALADEGKRGFSLFLPAGHLFEHEGFLATLLGPRSEAWLRTAAGDPRSAIDVFPWWQRDRDARYLRDLALAHCWLDVRWRPPVDDEERALMQRVATWLERAHAMDPELDLPWEAQAEILTHLGEESLRSTRAQLKAESRHDPRNARAPIGYRRQPVRAMLSGGWSMRIDGDLAERWEERGTFVAWDARRSVWFTSLTVQSEAGAPSASAEETLAALPPLSSDELLELESGALRGVACFVEEEHDGRPVIRLEAHAAVGANAAIGTLVFVEDADREWALETWGSLTHEDARR